jgi:tRNA 2-thiouridine synthesizing protein A
MGVPEFLKRPWRPEVAYPQMYTSQALTKLPRGSMLKVIIDNPPSIENIKSVAQKAGAKSVSVNSRGGEWDITIEI